MVQELSAGPDWHQLNDQLNVNHCSNRADVVLHVDEMIEVLHER